jgi:hypothetical protein
VGVIERFASGCLSRSGKERARAGSLIREQKHFFLRIPNSVLGW